MFVFTEHTIFDNGLIFILGQDNPTIGIILCSEKDQAVAKFSVLQENKQLFATKYMLYLPTEKELQELVETDRNILEEAAATYYAWPGYYTSLIRSGS